MARVKGGIAGSGKSLSTHLCRIDWPDGAPFSHPVSMQIYGLKFLLLLTFLVQVVAGFLLRPLYIDGSYWIYFVIHRGTFYYDLRFHRLIGLIPQLIPLLLQKLKAGISTSIFPELLSFSLYYTLYPFLFLFFIGLYLRSKKQLGLIIFPILYYSLIHCSAQGFYVNIATDASLVFWFAFFVIWFEKSWRLFLYSLPGVLFILLGYELAPIYLCLLLLPLVYRYKIKKDLSLKVTTLFGTPLFLLMLGYTFAIIIVPKLVSRPIVQTLFMDSLLSFPQGLTLYSWFSLILLPLFVILSKPKSLKILNTVIILVFILCLLSSSTTNTANLWDWSYDSRTTVYFRNSILVLVFILCDFYRPDVKKSFITIASLALVLSLVQDIRMNSAWPKWTGQIQKILKSPPVCNYMEETRLQVQIDTKVFPAWALPYTSILFQYTKRPSSILFYKKAANNVPDKYRNPCLTFTRGMYTIPYFLHRLHSLSDGFIMPAPASHDGSIFFSDHKYVFSIIELPFYTNSSYRVEPHLFRKNVHYKLTFNLRGRSGWDVFPIARIGLGNKILKEFTVTDTYRLYSVDYTPREDHEAQVSISYINDDKDMVAKGNRNLFLKGVFLSTSEIGHQSRL